MRMSLVAPLMLLALAQAQAQSTPEAFLGLIPAAPKSVCAAKSTERQAFQTEANRVLRIMDEQIELRKKQEKDQSKSAEKDMKKKLRASGIDTSEAEQKRVEAMSDQEKMAYAMKMAANMDPQIMQEMAARGQAGAQGAQLSMNSPSIARLTKVKAKYEALEAEYRKLGGSSTGRSYSGRDFSSAPIPGVSAQLCQQFAPKYQALLAEHLAALKAALPDYKRAAESQAAAIGAKKEQAVSVEAMKEIREYVVRLREIVRFNQGVD